VQEHLLDGPVRVRNVLGFPRRPPSGLIRSPTGAAWQAANALQVECLLIDVHSIYSEAVVPFCPGFHRSLHLMWSLYPPLCHAHRQRLPRCQSRREVSHVQERRYTKTRGKANRKSNIHIPVLLSLKLCLGTE